MTVLLFAMLIAHLVSKRALEPVKLLNKKARQMLKNSSVEFEHSLF